MAAAMQNYAKFDSRIEDTLINQNTAGYYGQPDYVNGGLVGVGNIFHMIGEIINLLSILIIGLGLVFGFFFFLYIIVSLFTKGGEKTSEELKGFLVGTYRTTGKGLQFSFGKLKASFGYLSQRKMLFAFLLVGLLLLNFFANVLSGNSHFLRWTKIGDSYVGVDLKNHKIIPPGYLLYSPIMTNFFLSPTNNFDFEIAEVTANTSEELGVTLDYRVGFKLIDEKRLDFYKKYGAKDIKLVSSDIVMPRLLETIKGIIKSYSYKDISSKHNEIKNITIEEANKILKPIGVELQEVNILDIRLPDTYLKSKQDLLNAETELKLAEAKLETQKKDSEKKLLEAQNLKSVKIIEAEAIAESNRIINSQATTPAILEMKRLENEALKISKWDGKLPTSVGKEFEFLR